MIIKSGGIGPKLIGAAAVATAGLSLFGASSAFASETLSAGAATVVSPGTSNPLNSGGSNQAFDLQLPNLAACSKDTANGNYLVQTFYVPANSPSNGNLDALTWSGSGLISNNPPNYPLYDTSYNPVVNKATAPTTGQVIGLPDFLWGGSPPIGPNFTGVPNPPIPGVLSPDPNSDIAEVGIACATNTRSVDKFWSVKIKFTAAPNDPNGYTWSVVQSGPPPQTPESPLAIALPLSAAALLGVGVLVLRGRRKANTVG